jgi:hypothetical protein
VSACGRTATFAWVHSQLETFGRGAQIPRRQSPAAGLSGRVTLLLENYRDLEGRYDKLVSIEMIEVVGHQF